MRPNDPGRPPFPEADQQTRKTPPVARCASGALASFPGAGTCHRCCGRRSQRHCDLFADRRPVRLRHALDAGSVLSLDGSHPGSERMDRAGQRGRTGAQHPASLSAVAVLRGRRHPPLCECDQSGRGHRRHGRRARPTHRGTRSSLYPDVRRHLPRGRGVRLLREIREGPEVRNPGAPGLCNRRLRGACAGA